MAAVCLSVLGGFELTLGRGAAIHLPTRKAQALLAYLAIQPGQAHPRDKLAALLWGDVPEGQARASLRQTLSLLGKALDDAPTVCLLTEGRTVALVPGAIDVDVTRFEAAAAEGTPESLERAVQLYRGDLLDGLVLDEAAFESWLLDERERLRDIAIEALAKLLAHHQAPGGNPERAVQAGARLLSLDPCQEPVHRALMRLYVRQDRHAAALRQYQVCVTALRRELNAEPAAETKRVYREILQQQVPAESASSTVEASWASPPPLEAPARETPIFGRGVELRRLGELLEDAWKGSARVALVMGEAGIGKTRLVEELRALAVLSSGGAVVGHCYETEQILPFAPWVEAFRAAGVGGDVAPVDALPLSVLVTLGRLFPELNPPGAELPQDPDNPLRLFEALTQLAAALAARAPLLVVLEDLHWADDMTLRFFSFLARRLPGARLLVVGTAREEEIARTPSLRRTLDELGRHPTFTSLPIGPLSDIDTATLVRALAKTGADAVAVAGLAEQVWRSSGGIPFVAMETMRAIQDGVVSAMPGGVAVAATVRDLILRRFERLSVPGRQLAAVAAVANGPLEFGLLRRATGLPDGEAAEGLEELVRHRIFHGAGEGFDFTHDRLRQVVDAELLAPRRATLHAAIAEALEALHEGRLGPVYDRLAHHYARTDDGVKAVHYLTRFAESAARRGGHADALAALDQALAHVARLPAAAREDRRLDLLLRKGRALFSLGRFREGADLLGPEEAAVEATGDARRIGPYHFLLGSLLNYLGVHDGAIRSAERALEAAQRSGDLPTMGKARFLLALESFWRRPAEGVEHAREAVRLFSMTSERWWLGQAYGMLGLNYSYRGRLAEALAAEAEAHAIAQALDDRVLESSAAWMTGFVQILAGEWDVAVAACRRSADLALDALNKVFALGMLALAYVEKGEADAALPMLDEAIPQTQRYRYPQFEGLLLSFQGHAHLLKGDLARAHELVTRGAAITRASGYVYGHGWSQRILARIARAGGDDKAAAALYEDAIATFASMGAPYEVGRTALELAEVLRAEGDASGARDAARRAIDPLRELGFTELASRAERLL